MSLLLLFLLSISTVHSLTHLSDISALKSLVSSIKFIPPYSCLATWQFSTSDPCAQPHTNFSCGLQCDTVSVPNRVTHITLDPAGYSGSLSPLISSLSSLSVLDLSDNAFHGPIPPSISNLKSLQILVLKSNSFSGQIPPSIFSIQSIETVDFSFNSLSGTLPNLNSSPNLRRLDISYNKISGGIPKLAPNLLVLALRGNQLSGSLIKSSFAESTQLEVIELGQNSFSGSLEHWFFLLPSLQQVDLTNNSLTRVEVWKPASASSNLVAVDLGFNKIEGTISENISGYPMLSSLSLRYNRLHGSIPAALVKKGSYLKRLFLDGNFLNGIPPNELFSGTMPLSGSLGDNCLAECPLSSELCAQSQKPMALCRQAYGGKLRS